MRLRPVETSRPGRSGPGRSRWAAAAAGAAAPLMLGCPQQPSAEFVPPPPPRVTVASPVLDEVVVYDESPGRVGAEQSVQLIARVKGFIKEITFDDGGFVEPGEILFRIEPEEYEAAVAQAEAAVASAKASRDLAETRLERIERAVEKQAASDIELLEARAERDAAVAAVDSAEAVLQAAELDLAYTEVASPFRGRVSERAVDPGEFVGAGGTSVLSEVTSLDPIFVYWTASERELLEFQAAGGRIREAPPAEDERIRLKFKRADDSIYSRDGVLDYVSPRIDEATGTLRLRARVANPEFELFPGQFVRVMRARFEGEALLVPEAAVVRDVVGPHLLVVGPDNVVARRDVELGPLVDGRRIIREGVAVSDRIVTIGVQRARVGLPVDPQPAGDAPAAPPAAG